VVDELHGRRRLLDGGLRAGLVECIKNAVERHDWTLDHWVVLENHYHLLVQSRLGADLPDVIRAIHGSSAVGIRARTGCALPVWYNYWDYCPRHEGDWYRHLNYLLWNPIKHDYVRDLRDWPDSSFHALLATEGRERLVAQFRAYPDFRELDVDDDY
jgi:putative transposase